MNDDTSWRSAFEQTFGCIPIKRIAKNFKMEYLERLLLQRRWDRALQSVTFDPRISTIKELEYNQQSDTLTLISSDTGIIASCQPKTGKIFKNNLYVDQNNEALPVSAFEINK